MSFIPITSDDVESFTIVTHPKRSFVSSSTGGVTGSVYLYARRSSVERDSSVSSAFVDSTFKDNSVESALAHLQAQMVGVSGSGYDYVDQYMNFVDTLGTRDRSKTLGITRFVPPSRFDSYTMRKLVVKDVLYHYYRATSPNMQWAYTNYNSLNFFTASCVPTGSVLLYPNVNGAYSPSGSFSIDCYVNPRYTTPDVDGRFRAGTIMHLSSTFALSMITGSAKDENGRPKGFRLQLQLSHSADIAPSLATTGSYPKDLVFLSSDNSLVHNRWHHVVVRWGAGQQNDGTGSFNIDGADVGTFCVPSASIMPAPYTSKGNPDVLCVGNFYEGTNAGTSVQANFFAQDPADREGLVALLSTTGVDQPTRFNFAHPLNAELHDLSLRNKFLTNADIAFSSSYGPQELDDTYMMYVPPFFTRTSPTRKIVGTMGGVLQTPFFAIDGKTDDPFNVAMSFGVCGFYVNLENYLRDFANDTTPRAYNMTASIDSSTTMTLYANDVLYSSGDVRARNLLIMPCDDGKFVPNYSLLKNEDDTTKYVDSLGLENYSLVSLDDMLNDTSKLFGTSFAYGDRTEEQGSEYIDDQIGFTPENPAAPAGRAYANFVSSSNRQITLGTYEQGVQANAPLTVYQRTFDASSNQVVFFDVSNVLYGQRIYPGSLKMIDASLSGSNDRVKITLRDDGNGNLYRADSDTQCATWNSVGNVFYSEGIIVVKNPHLCLYGKDTFDVEFSGEQNVHVMGINVFAAANSSFSSSNPTFQPLSPSGYANDPDKEFVYVSNVLFHDDNLNVVAKASLAQPLVKRRGDKYMLKFKFDY